MSPRVKISKRDQDKCVTYLPLMQIMSDMHPTSRSVLVKHLDRPSQSALVHAIRVVYSGLAKDDDCYPPKVRQMLRRLLRQKPRLFKTLLASRSNKVSKLQQSALNDVGGGVIGTILSIVVPYVIGQLMKK